MNLRYGKAGVPHVVDTAEECVVAAGCLCTTFDDVPGNDCPSKFVVIRFTPVKVRGSRPHRE